MNDLRLMKLLYLAERESIFELGASFTGARLRSLPNGPVLSEFLGLMKGEMSASIWSDNFIFVPRSGADSNHVVLKGNIDPSNYLSEAEMEILESIWAKHKEKDKWALVDLTHEFPEWDKSVSIKNASVRSKAISIKDILIRGYNMQPEDAASLANSIEYYQSI